MKAYEAQGLSYRKNKSAKGLKEIYKKIEEAAGNGNFSVKLLVCYDWGDKYALRDQLVEDGYEVSLSHVQTSPNDGDDYLSIYWQDGE